MLADETRVSRMRLLLEALYGGDLQELTLDVLHYSVATETPFRDLFMAAQEVYMQGLASAKRRAAETESQ